MKSPVRSFCYLVLFCLLACQALALAAPVITTHPADISGAIGTQAIFTVVATGNPAPTYQWLLNGAPVAGQTAASFTPFIVDGYHNGWTFTCVVTNSSGTVTSRTATLTVSGSTPAAPAIMIQPADIIRPIGTQATFTVWATGNPAPTYQWLLNGTPVAGLTTATWPPFTVDGYHNGWTFTCVATNASGTVTSRSATLTVGAAGGGPTITTQPTDVIRAIGSPATFTVVATGTPAPTYQWLINGVPVNRQTAASFTPFIVDAYHNGWTFACVVTNVHGTVTSRAAIVVVGAPPDSNSFGYDAAGRLTSSIQADGLTWAYSPDAEGSVLTTAQAAADTSASGGLGNGIPDWWELSYFGSRLADSLARPFAAQGDYTSYLMKFALGVDPTAKYSGQAFTSGTLAYIDGRSYRSVTFIRSRNAGAMLSPQQSSDGVNWFSGPAYFAEVSVEDLGDGTERVVMRCLTALPAGANLLFRLKADGGAGYVDYSSAPAVIPAAPGWALAGLGLVLLIAIAGRSLRRGSLAGAASLVVVLLMVFHSQAQAQVDESGDPGWIAIGASPDAPARATLLSPMASLGTQSMVLYAPTAQAIDDTPGRDLQALASGLNNDPVRIFNYVRNRIDYQAYYGSFKGAYLTYIDGAGNDMDQASLLIALLKQAGFPTADYVYGSYTMPATAGSGYSLCNWLRVGTAAQMSMVVTYSGCPIVSAPASTYTVDHVCVKVTIAGTEYKLDPSLKQYEVKPALFDLKTASGYSRSQLLQDAGGTDTTDYALNIDRTKVENRLSLYSATLRDYIRTNFPNAEMEDIVGGGHIRQQPITALAQASPPFAYTDKALPSVFRGTLQVKIDSDIDVTFNTDSLQGARLSLTYSGNNAQLWLGDTKVAEQTTGSGPTASCTLSIVHPYAPLYTRPITKTFSRNPGYSYDLSYAVYPNSESSGQINLSSRLLQNYLAAGKTNSDREVMTETLHSLGLKWTRQVALTNAMYSRLYSVYYQLGHLLGRTAQEDSFYVDMPGLASLTIDSVGGYPGSSPTSLANIPFNASGFVHSAMEHGDIEQNTNSTAASTTKCLTLANGQGQRIYKLTSANVASIITASNTSTVLTNYSADQLGTFRTSAASGSVLLVHANGKMYENPADTLNKWHGSGYAVFSNQQVGMVISGTFLTSGGYAFNKAIIDPYKWNLANLAQSSQWTALPNLTPVRGADPVDLLTGAFTMETTDLTLGEPGSPRGLSFARYYDSSRNFAASSLGNGWRHSCEGKVALSTELDNAFGLTQPTDAAQTIMGFVAVADFADTAMTPKEILVGALSANWLVGRMKNNAANVQLGNQRMTYISFPDGTWNPPPGSTTALTGSLGGFTLSPRLGGSITFDAKDRISQWKDVDNNTQSYTYDDIDTGYMVYPTPSTSFWVTTHAATNKLATVRDQFGRTLTFTYYSTGAGSGLLQNVTDSTARTVNYSYTGGTFSGANLTGITDPENFNTTLVYDPRNRLTDWKDHALAVVTHNDYDGFDRVYQQLSQGLAAHTWQLRYSPGATLEIDPANGLTAHLFDFKNRNVGTIDALGHASSSFYDGQNHVVKSIDATGRQLTAQFDGNQNMANTTDNAGKSTIYTYETSAPWRLLAVTDPTNKTTSYDYDAKNHLKSVTDPGLRKTQYFYHANGDGLLDHVIDSAGKTTSITAYDGYGNPTAVTRADLTTTSATYNARGDLLTSTDGRNQKTTFTYDKRRLLLTSTDARNQVTRYTYDSHGTPSTTTDRNNKVTTTVYDNLGHMRSLQAPDTGAVIYNYDARDWATGTTDSLNHSTTIGYDAAQRRRSVTNALNIVTARTTYDDAGRPTTQADGLGNTTRYFYNTAGRLDYTLDPLRQRTDHTYDDAGRPLTLKNRLGKTFGFGYAADGLASTFTYPTTRQSQIIDRDAHGLPQNTKSAGGQTATLTYDAMGRVKTRTDYVGTIVWTYDAEGNATDVTENGTANIHRDFDELGRVTSCTDTLGYTIGYTYDNEGNLKTIVYPGNITVTYTYDGANRLKTVTDWANRVTTYNYDTAGRLQTVDRPNSTRQHPTFDAANRLVGSAEEKMSGTTVTGILWQADYGYDNANRLTSYKPAPVAKTAPPPPVALTFDADNQLATYNGTTIGCDLDGNLRSAPLNGTLAGALGWDRRNRLTSSSPDNSATVSYTYDAENRRTTSAGATGLRQYVYSRGAGLDRLLVRRNSDGSLTRYVYGAGLLYEVPFAANGTEGNPTYYHFNWRGDTVALSDYAGNVTARMSYSPYGERKIDPAVGSGTVDTPFCFNGQWGVMTETSGLLYMQARYYSPILKRFLNEDPAGFAGGRNLYAYCSGDPVNAMDPFGLGKVSAASNFGSSSTFSGVAGAALNGADRFTTQFNSLLWNTVNGQGLADLVGTATGYLYSLADPATRSGAWSNTVDDFSRLGSAQEWKNTGSYMISPEGLASAAFMIDATLAGGLGRGNCFPAGTKVSTSHGDVNIEDIEVGDLVYAYDFATGTVVESRVSETPRHFTYYWVEIQVAGETIKSTRKHPFWVQSENRWVDAVDLKAGMDVRLLTGQTAAIVSTFVHELQNPETTYNFEVEVQHNYFVGHAHVLVHNPPDGSYTNTHLSGKEYVGKGDATRAAESAVEKALKFNDPLVKTNWTPANGTADSFVQEEMRLRVAGGPRGNTYNKINSPGNMIARGSGCP